MSALSKILRDTEDNGLMFWCPGCNEAHRIQHGSGPGPRWGWNGNVEKPTFTPSVLVTGGHYVSFHKPGDHCWCTFAAEHPEEKAVPKCYRCHSFVTDGRIQFLSDCSDHLAGQTVDLPVWPEAEPA